MRNIVRNKCLIVSYNPQHMDSNIGAAIQFGEGEGNFVACLAFFCVTFVLAFKHQAFGQQDYSLYTLAKQKMSPRYNSQHQTHYADILVT
jgi:hypothetical protein